MSKVKKGLAAEHIAKAKFLLEGWNIYQEVNYDSKIDLLIEKDNQYFRMQVKCVNDEGILAFRKLTHSKTAHKQYHYSCKDIDFFVGVDLKTFDLYIVPVTEISRSSRRTSGLGKYKNNFNLGPCCGNAVSALPQVGETFDNGNTELGYINPSVETLRGASNYNMFREKSGGILIKDSGYAYDDEGSLFKTGTIVYDEDKVQQSNQ